MRIDQDKLKFLQPKGDGSSVAQCPACELLGRDLNGKNHLKVYPEGNFSCVAFPKDDNHRAEILRLVGTESKESSEEYIDPRPSEPKLKIEKIYAEQLLEQLLKDYDFYKQRDIDEGVLQELHSGIALKGSMYNRFVFPIYDVGGRIHGFSGRTLNGSKIKWKHIGVVSHWVYPAYFVEKSIKSAGEIILVESIGDAIKLMSCGIRHVLVLFGTNLHPKLFSYIIAKNPNKIYISTNNDEHEVGQFAAQKIYDKLANFFDEGKLEIKHPTKKDFGEMNHEEITEFWRKTHAG